MTCDCGNQTAYRLSFRGSRFFCNRCGSLPSVSNPDVYFKGAYLDTNLVDVNKPEQKDGVWIESRGQKAAILNKLGMIEAGDKRHGMRNEDRSLIRRAQERQR